MPRATQYSLRSFMDRVALPTGDGCWEWQGYIRENGYGTIGRHDRAHRVAYELFIGPIPTGLDVCHRCDNRRCVNPAHLFAGTRTDNMRDCVAKGRLTQGDRRGERNGAAKLSASDVADIRAEFAANPGMNQTRTALKYGVTPGAIWLIVHGRKWRHLNDAS